MIVHRKRVEFHCPKCLGGNYGTSGADNWETAEGYCNGPGYRGDVSCRFKWKRSEDWKVFYIVQITKFETKEEFLASREQVGY